MSAISIGEIRPVGYVVSEWKTLDDVGITGRDAIIRIQDEYLPALHRMNEHNYFWVLNWFHLADRSVRQVSPLQVNEKTPPFGIFGLRAASRPNPIALSLVKLCDIQGCELHVSGMDAVDGTLVLDIKPYFESDIVFSPQTPYIRPHSEKMRAAVFRKQALAHHGEMCAGLEIGIKMALLADDYFGQIQAKDLTLTVRGDACLADVLQGLSRARLANPVRFSYTADEVKREVIWRKNGKTMTIVVNPEAALTAVEELSPTDLFRIAYS